MHGATRLERCSDFDAPHAAARAPSSRLRAVPLRRGARALAGPLGRAGRAAAYGKLPARTSTPGDHLQTTYNSGSPGTSSRTDARRGSTPTASNPRRRSGRTTAGRSRSCSAAARAVRDRRRVERVRALSYLDGAAAAWLRSLRLPLDAALVGGLRSRSRRTARSRPPRTSARAGRDAAPALVVGARDPASLARGCGDRLGAAVRAGAPRARGNPFLSRSRRRAQTKAGRRSRRGGKRRCRTRGLAHGDPRNDGRVRPTVRVQVERHRRRCCSTSSRGTRVTGLETFVFVGWLVPLAAIAGLVLLSRRERARGRARARRARALPARARREHAGVRAALERRASVSATRACRRGSWRSRASVSPLPVAFQAVERVPWRYAAFVAIPLVALDLRVDVYRPMGADEGTPSTHGSAKAGCSSVPSTSPSCSRAASISITRSRRRARAARLLDDRAA